MWQKHPKHFNDSTSSIHMFIRWIMHVLWDLRNMSDSKYIQVEKQFHFHSEFGCRFTYDTCKYIIFLIYYSDNYLKKKHYLWFILGPLCRKWFTFFLQYFETFRHLSVTFLSRKMFYFPIFLDIFRLRIFLIPSFRIWSSFV